MTEVISELVSGSRLRKFGGHVLCKIAHARTGWTLYLSSFSTPGFDDYARRGTLQSGVILSNDQARIGHRPVSVSARNHSREHARQVLLSNSEALLEILDSNHLHCIAA